MAELFLSLVIGVGMVMRPVSMCHMTDALARGDAPELREHAISASAASVELFAPSARYWMASQPRPPDDVPSALY